MNVREGDLAKSICARLHPNIVPVEVLGVDQVKIARVGDTLTNLPVGEQRHILVDIVAVARNGDLMIERGALNISRCHLWRGGGKLVIPSMRLRYVECVQIAPSERFKGL